MVFENFLRIEWYMWPFENLPNLIGHRTSGVHKTLSEFGYLNKYSSCFHEVVAKKDLQINKKTRAQ